MSYPNVPGRIGAVVSLGMASLAELDSVYGLEDVADMIEIARVDAANERELRARRQREQARAS